MDGAEEWRPVAGYEGLYSVSDLGRVRREGGGVLKPMTLEARGRRRVVKLSRGGRTRIFRVHLLVAAAFLDNADNARSVAFRDKSIPSDALSNLALGKKWYRVPPPLAEAVVKTDRPGAYFVHQFGLDASTVSRLRRGRAPREAKQVPAGETYESWVPVPGYAGLYSVSDLGRVRRDAPFDGRPPRILKTMIHKSDGLLVNLYKGGEMERVRILPLLRDAFGLPG